jgi:hypothetical protein
VLDGGLVLGSGNNVQGVDFGTTAGFAVSGASVGTFHLNDATTGVINNASGGGISGGAATSSTSTSTASRRAAAPTASR